MASHSNGIGVVQYDLVGVGNAVGTTIRSTRALTNHLTVEGSLPLAWPVESFGRTRLSSPEAHLQYHWRVGSFRPYAGGGGGVSWRDAGALGRSEVNLTLSAAGGMRFDIFGSDRSFRRAASARHQAELRSKHR